MNGQLNAPAALNPDKTLPVHVGQEAGWVPETYGQCEENIPTPTDTGTPTPGRPGPKIEKELNSCVRHFAVKNENQ
jgi:hypothetical protein